MMAGNGQKLEFDDKECHHFASMNYPLTSSKVQIHLVEEVRDLLFRRQLQQYFRRVNCDDFPSGITRIIREKAGTLLFPHPIRADAPRGRRGPQCLLHLSHFPLEMIADISAWCV
jgi:hypothetical protein